MAYSSCHATDIRRAMTDSRNIPPAMRTIAVLRTHEAERVRMETVNVTVRMERQTRDDAAKLFSELGPGTTQAINMFLKQALAISFWAACISLLPCCMLFLPVLTPFRA